MILLLFGKEKYLLKEKQREIEKEYKEKHNNVLSLEKINAEKISFFAFFDLFLQNSMFVKKKLFFLENVFSNPSFKKEFLKYFNQLSESKHVIVLLEKEIKKSDSLLKKISKKQEFEALTKAKLRAFSQKEFQKYGAEIEPIALEALLNRVSCLFQLSNEIKKLSAFSKRIRKQDIDLFIKPGSTPEIFKTIDALAERNKKRALFLIEQHLEKGDSPFYLLSMISYQIRNLLLMKQKKPLKIHPFVQKKLRALSARFSFEELKNIYQKIFEADLMSKTSRMTPEAALRHLILSF